MLTGRRYQKTSSPLAEGCLNHASIIHIVISDFSFKNLSIWLFISKNICVCPYTTGFTAALFDLRCVRWMARWWLGETYDTDF
jgi:hypothetical protein